MSAVLAHPGNPLPALPLSEKEWHTDASGMVCRAIAAALADEG